VPNASYPENVCRDSCTYCGDGLVNNGEACDFNDPSAPSNCSNMCRFVDFQGCTPGYWRQEHHFGNWEFYTPSELFSDIFGRTFTVESHPGGGSRVTVHNPTMLEAVWADGGALEKLTSHAASALLNASGAAVDYAFSEAEVIAMFQSAYDSGDFEPTKNLFANANEEGCPLARSRPPRSR